MESHPSSHPYDPKVIATLEKTREVPSDWHVLVADIAGSTRAVKSGQSRIVNLVGAACIAAIRNQYRIEEVPYVFGGDGATFLCHESLLLECMRLLEDVSLMAKSQFGLELRTGSLPVSKVAALGGKIHLGFINWSSEEKLPYFRGNGIALAESLIKNQDPKAALIRTAKEDPSSLEGLSCKLSPFPSTRGSILSLLVESRIEIQEEDRVFKEIFECLDNNAKLQEMRPVKSSSLSRKWISRDLFSEAKLKSRTKSWPDQLTSLVVVLLQTWFTNVVLKFGLQTKVLGDPEHYMSRLISQSDWIKCDGLLRMVIDVTPAEQSSLLEKLEHLHSQKKIYYGVNSSNHALMTCYFKTATEDQHTHFIDGGDGGFTLAALELKKQKKAEN